MKSLDDFAKSGTATLSVIPSKEGIQFFLLLIGKCEPVPIYSICRKWQCCQIRQKPIC